jgi:DUF4097 and DUF4098 domain-containing protein YvlB
VEFILLIPQDYNVEINTSGGSASVKDLTGKIYARTAGGLINVNNIIGHVKLHTSGGSIDTDNITGNIDAHTSGGNINVTVNKQLTEDAKLTTSGESITANFIPITQININASTSGG